MERAYESYARGWRVGGGTNDSTLFCIIFAQRWTNTNIGRGE